MYIHMFFSCYITKNITEKKDKKTRMHLFPFYFNDYFNELI